MAVYVFVTTTCDTNLGNDIVLPGRYRDRVRRQMAIHLTDYLGHQLKDDSVLEILEYHDMEVIYRFDRTHENLPDQYTAAARDAGFEFCFDENQKLMTIFCYVQGRDGFAPIDLSIIGVQIFETLSEAKETAAKERLSYKHNDGMEFLGRRMSWIKFVYGAQTVHYEFSPGALSVITLAVQK